jgi:hypothetical protein
VGLIWQLLWPLLLSKLHHNKLTMVIRVLLPQLPSRAPSILPQNWLRSGTLWHCAFQNPLRLITPLPITNSSGAISISENIIQWLTGWDPDCVCFKIMVKLACAHDYRVTNILHLGIKSLGHCEDLQNEIHWELLLHYFAILRYFFLGH